MPNVSVSKAAVFEQRKRDGMQEQAIKHHTEAMEKQGNAINSLIEHQRQLEEWAERFSAMTLRERFRWLLLGR